MQHALLPFLAALLALCHAQLPPPILPSAWEWPFPRSPGGAPLVPLASLLHEASDAIYLVLANCLPEPTEYGGPAPFQPCTAVAPPDAALAASLYRLSAASGVVQWVTPLRAASVGPRSLRPSQQGPGFSALLPADLLRQLPARRELQQQGPLPTSWAPMTVSSSGSTVFLTVQGSPDATATTAQGDPTPPFSILAFDAARGTPLWNASDATLHLSILPTTRLMRQESFVSILHTGAFPSPSGVDGKSLLLPLALPRAGGLLVARNAAAAPLLTASLQALDERTGALLWSSPAMEAPDEEFSLVLNAELSLALAVVGRRAAGTGAAAASRWALPGSVSAIDLRNGRVAWSLPRASPRATDPLTTVFISAAFPPATGTLLLTVAAEATLEEYSRGYLQGLPTNLTQMLVNASTGRLLWKRDSTPGNPRSIVSMLTSDARAEGIVSYARGASTYVDVASDQFESALPTLLLQSYGSAGAVAWRWPLPSGGATITDDETSSTINVVSLGPAASRGQNFVKAYSSAAAGAAARPPVLLAVGYQYRETVAFAPTPITDDAPAPQLTQVAVRFNTSAYLVDAATGRTLHTLPDTLALGGAASANFSFLLPDCAMGAGGGTYVLGLASSPQGPEAWDPSDDPPILFQMLGAWQQQQQQQQPGFAWRKPVHDMHTLNAAFRAGVNPMGLCGDAGYVIVGAALSGIGLGLGGSSGSSSSSSGSGSGALPVFGVSRLAPPGPSASTTPSLTPSLRPPPPPASASATPAAVAAVASVGALLGLGALGAGLYALRSRGLACFKKGGVWGAGSGAPKGAVELRDAPSAAPAWGGGSSSSSSSSGGSSGSSSSDSSSAEVVVGVEQAQPPQLPGASL